MKSTRKIEYDRDYETEVETYVDDDDYKFDCDGIDDTEMLAEGLNLRQLALD